MNTNRISWNDYRGRENSYGSNQTQGNSGLANSYYGKTGQILFRIWELLSKIHKQILQIGTTIEWIVEKRQDI